MRTMFVNPSASMSNPRRRRKRSRRRRRNVDLSAAANPRRRRRGRRRRSARVSRGYPLTVRSNAGIVPFTSNPLILDNPRRRSRRRRNNPMANLSKLSLNNVLSKTVKYGGGAAAGAALNILGLRRIQNDWIRNGVRIGAAVVGAALVPGEIGAAYAGATLYPLFAEVALLTKLVQPAGAPTEADLSEISADLEDVLDELDIDGDDDDDIW